MDSGLKWPLSPSSRGQLDDDFFINIMAISCHVYICRAQDIFTHQAYHGEYNEVYSFFLHFLYLE